MANTVKIPGYVKIIMAVSAIFMPLFLILPFFFWTGTDTQGLELDSKSLQAGRLAPVGKLNVGAPKAEEAAAAAVLEPQKVYDTVCAACHTAGISGAPKFGDTAAWQAKLNERGGADKLAEQAIKGINAMPPKGGTTLSDDDFKKMVAFMLIHANLDSGDLPKPDAGAPADAKPAADEGKSAAEAVSQPAEAGQAPEKAADTAAEAASDAGASEKAQQAAAEQAASAQEQANSAPAADSEKTAEQPAQ